MKARLFCLSVALAALTVACSKSSAPEQSSSSPATPTAPSTPVSTNKNDYPVFPNADAGADPSVPAEQGGKGFDGKGWETNTDFDLIGDPHAIKGGTYHDFTIDFPATLRVAGPEANSETAASITSMVYESLLGIDPTSDNYVPALATHWKISPDKMTYWFRIDPNARFSDGTPVTSDDVLATFELMMDQTLQDPVSRMTYGKMERPVAESKYIVRVKAKELNWRNFLYFSGMPILPAHILKGVNGEKYIKEFNYKMPTGSGPYIVNEGDMHRGQSITVRRRKDYWAEKYRANVGVNNFDAWQIAIVRDVNLAFEMFKKGELDTYYFFSYNTRRWMEDLDIPAAQRGLIQKSKVYNDAPRRWDGFSFNTRQAPLSDIRVRKALTLLLNRRQIIDKLMYGLYEPLNSFFAGSPYENPGNPKNEYDPAAALKLLADAGWSARDSQGRLTKGGVPLQIELIYHSTTLEPQLTVYQEELRKAGISLNLRLVTFETKIQLIDDRKFQIAEVIYGGLRFPNPESSWYSALADQPNSGNETGFKSARVDELCAAYDKMFNIQDRIKAVREIDGIVANSYNYTLAWDLPYRRIAYWNKFGFPPGHFTRIGDENSIPALWWIDPAKEAKVQQAIKDSSVKLPIENIDDKYWIEYAKSHPAASTVQSQQ